eukprot:NODE_361_length_2356_cov_34.170031_g337_i0.p1 GENE.NODE_361_length_2356_cov_34.170031_g337_i0~~NODE_361_length_2356_cov_34.170031_g337_i0.p1  ORF type:complete len:742 (-),score=146.36 NODE_361_length_2356_cov_34.170031_g337_i0:130-2097(-)
MRYFNLTAGVWLDAHVAAPPLIYASVVQWQDHLLLYGGGFDLLSLRQYPLTFRPHTGEWSELEASKGKLPSGRRGHTALGIRKTMTVFGGVDFYGPLNDVWALTLDFGWFNAKILGVPPHKRNFHTAVEWQQNMYIFGGFSNDLHLNDIWLFAFDDTWQTILPVGIQPVERLAHTAVRYGPRMIIFGGDAGVWGGYRNDLWEFHFRTEIWTEVRFLGPSPNPRCHHSAILFGNALIVHAGAEYDPITRTASTVYSDTWYFVPDAESNPTTTSTLTSTISSALTTPLDQDSTPSYLLAVVVATSVVLCLLLSLGFLCLYRRSHNFVRVYVAPADPINPQPSVLVSRRISPEIDIPSLSTTKFQFTSVVLGKGSFGVVHLGFDMDTSQPVALKVLQHNVDTERANRMELQMLQLLDHKNIVGFLGTWQQGPLIIIAQEHCAGGSLYDMILKFERISVYLTQRYMRGALYGLEYLHNECFIHMDIKPHNIFIDHRAICKLGDFGTVVPLGVVPRCLVGTPLYMPPEVTPASPAAIATDIWAMGITILHIILGRHPLRDCGFSNNRPLIPLPFPVPVQLPPNLSALVGLCLLESMCDRPSATEMLNHSFFREPIDFNAEPSNEDIEGDLQSAIAHNTTVVTTTFETMVVNSEHTTVVRD